MSTPRPKKKAMRNEPLFYDEAKVRKAIWLTPSTWDTLKQVAESEGVSVSELVERWGRHLKVPAASDHA
ncbi:MAG: helix-turn-helix domain-containing protein [Nostocaceae cyanobacterium]|nr:helix-turn-helix domain-containing protein [Nostocaceae cyanobacterium]